MVNYFYVISCRIGKRMQLNIRTNFLKGRIVLYEKEYVYTLSFVAAEKKIYRIIIKINREKMFDSSFLF